EARRARIASASAATRPAKSANVRSPLREKATTARGSRPTASNSPSGTKRGAAVGSLTTRSSSGAPRHAHALVHELHDLADRAHLLDVLVRQREAGLFLDPARERDAVEAVEVEIVLQVGLRRDLGGVDVELARQDREQTRLDLLSRGRHCGGHAPS